MISSTLFSRRRYIFIGCLLISAVFYQLRRSWCDNDGHLCLASSVNDLDSKGLQTEHVESKERISYQELQERIHKFVKSWTRPGEEHSSSHWPPYQDYVDSDYDPNRWEAFEWDNDFYTSNGIVNIQKEQSESEAIPPSVYPAYNSDLWKRTWRGEYVPCMGPRGQRLNQSEEDVVKAYRMGREAFPPVSVGDASETGIDLSLCFERYHRYGPYGFGEQEQETVSDWDHPKIRPDWNNIRWGRLQDQCLEVNRERYHEEARDPPDTRPEWASRAPRETIQSTQTPVDGFHLRTAVLIRTWEGYQYTENDLQAIRALITETALLSGAEYQVFLFVNVKDNNADFFGDPEVHDHILRQHVPEEFWGISILWSEALMEEWYPEVGDWQVYWSQFMPLQWFSKTYPEFEYVWNWETDVRYTGNHYSFFEGVSQFAKRLPRKFMWERSQRYFLPQAHGSYKQWLQETDLEIERAMREGTTCPVWGPQPYSASLQKPIGPTPPTTMDEDSFHWGVGEEADLITLLPMFDPVHTKWDYRDKIWNFVPGVRPHFTPEDGGDINFHYEEFVNIPRRVYINTVSRLSKRLLHAMHLENLAGRNMQAEMWPATVALHHGLKAVYSPHPIWSDRKWPGWYADAVFNADGGMAAQWSQAEDGVYAHDREHNFAGWSWYYNGVFAKSLYRRWLGWSSRDGSPLDGVGGPEFEDQGLLIEVPGSNPQTQTSEYAQVGGQGRLCLPAMLLHPVKKVYQEAED